MNGSPVAGLVRGWVDLYTRGLPADARAARRDQIDDDLWCQHAEAAALGRSGRSLDADLFMRLLFGMPSDISWRLAYRGQTPANLERRSTTSTRTLGVLAIVAGSFPGGLLILSFVIGEQALWISGVGLVLVLGSIISLPAAALGLAWQFQDRVGPLGGFGAIVLTIGVFTSIGGFVAPIFVGSAMLMSELARIGVVSRIVPIVHLATAIAAVATRIGLIFWPPGVVVGALLILYFVSWIAIGVSLIRGVLLPRATGA